MRTFFLEHFYHSVGEPGVVHCRQHFVGYPHIHIPRLQRIFGHPVGLSPSRPVPRFSLQQPQNRLNTWQPGDYEGDVFCSILDSFWFLGTLIYLSDSLRLYLHIHVYITYVILCAKQRSHPYNSTPEIRAGCFKSIQTTDLVMQPVEAILQIIPHVQYLVYYQTYVTCSTAQGGGGSFRNRKPIGEVGCCESRMAERSHWWTERWLMFPLFLSLSLTIYLPTYLSIYLSN